MEAASVAATGIAEPQQQISDFGRVIGALTSPGATFADIVRKPKWWTPPILLALFGILSVYVMNQRVDWRAFMDDQINNGIFADRIPPERKPQIIAEGAKAAPRRAYYGGALGSTLMGLWLGFVYWGVFNVLLGAGAKFRTAFSVATHSCVPYLVQAPIGMIVMYFKRYGDVDPEHIMATSVGAFLPERSAKWLVSLGGSFELFWIWTLCLLAIGFRAVNPKKVTMASAFAVVFGVWLVAVLVKVGVVAVLS